MNKTLIEDAGKKIGKCPISDKSALYVTPTELLAVASEVSIELEDSNEFYSTYIDQDDIRYVVAAQKERVIDFEEIKRVE